MDTETFIHALEAQLLMGHCGPAPHVALDRTITAYSWDVAQVRQALSVPLNALWEERLLALEGTGLATFVGYGGLTDDEGWPDRPREEFGELCIHAAGVLRLADLYGRPYVRYHESPAVLAHWQLVQAECQARLHAPHDAAVWAREWPERARARRCWYAECPHTDPEGGED